VRFYTEIELDALSAIEEERFDALADALANPDAADPTIDGTDLGASLADGRATVSMSVEATDQAGAAAKTVCTVRAAIHAIGDATPGWTRPPAGRQNAACCESRR
jgi:hypothetical protein